MQVVQDSNVKTIRVYRQAVKYIGGRDKERQEFGEPDTTRSLYQVYHLNEFGRADSVGNYQRHYYSYEGKSIVSYRLMDRSGVLISHAEISKNKNHEIVSTFYERGRLKSSSRFNEDSIMLEQLHFNNDTNWHYAIRFDPEQNLKTEEWRGKNGAYKIETYQWFTVDGLPSTFRHTLEQVVEGKSKIIRKEKTYPLDSAGNVVNKYLGRFDDPYIFYSYDRRYQKFKPLKFASQDLFRLDHLIKLKQHEELYTFSGIELVVRYEFEYEFR